MANHKSAAKRTLQNEKRRLRNRHVISTMRGRLKELRAAIEEGNAEAAQKLLTTSVTLLSKAAGKGVIHRNKASRTIGRLVKAVNKL
ncbi:MAG: 30S ribosomal protein S20 [Bradymonadia bacterium]